MSLRAGWRRVVAALVAGAWCAGEAAAAPAAPTAGTYTVIDLHPAGFEQSSGHGIGGGRQVGTAFNGSFVDTRAVVWSGSAQSTRVLHPPGYARSYASSVDGDLIGGWVRPDPSGTNQAVLWNAADGSIAASLHQAAHSQSYVRGLGGGQRVGTAGAISRAILWDGSSDAGVLLHPAGYINSHATGVAGGKQGGHGVPSNGRTNALLWSGSAQSYVVLNPFGATHSVVSGVADGQQAGNYVADGESRAVLWRGTAASAVDLHPDGWVYSYAFATNGRQQVGSGVRPSGGPERALLWNSTKESAVDLHALLPPEYVGSRAEGIDADGNVIGTAGLASGVDHAVMWAVPEPAAAAPIAVAIALASARSRRRRNARQAAR